jgi:hypothetical protein
MYTVEASNLTKHSPGNNIIDNFNFTEEYGAFSIFSEYKEHVKNNKLYFRRTGKAEVRIMKERK